MQESLVHKPTMSQMMLRLESENANMPLPKKPTSTLMRGFLDTELFSKGIDNASLNNVTVTMVNGRWLFEISPTWSLPHVCAVFLMKMYIC